MRACGKCGTEIPPGTKHFSDEESLIFCFHCVRVAEYVVEQYYVGGEYMGDSEHDEGIHFIDGADDDYEEPSTVPDGQTSIDDYLEEEAEA